MRKELLTLLLCCVYLPIAAQHNQILNKRFGEQVKYVDSVFAIEQSPYYLKKARNKYSSIYEFAQEHNDEQLKTYMSLLINTLELYESSRDDSARTGVLDTHQNRLLQQIGILEQQQNKYLYPTALMYYSSFLDFQGRYTHAFELKLKAYEIYAAYTLKEFPEKLLFLNSLGGSYYKFRDYYSSAETMKEVVAEKIYDNNYFTSVNTYALCYRNLNQWDTAEHYFNILYHEAIEYKRADWQLISKLNIAHTYYRSGRITKAHQYFTEAYEFAHKNGYNFGITESTARLAKIAFDSNYYAKAKRLAHEGLSAHNTNEWKFTYHSDAQRLYGVLAEVYEQEGNYRTAYLYLDSLLMVVDSTSANRLINLSTAIKAKSELLTDKYLREKENANIAEARRKRVLYTSIICIALIVVISILFFNRQYIRRKQLEAEKDAAETKLSASKQKLDSYTKNLQEKTRLIEQFSKEIEQYKNSANQEEKNSIVLRLQEATILTDEDWTDFRQMFEQVHAGYIYRLKEKLPDLTPGETRFMVLSKLRLSNKEMAGILGVGTSTVRKYKHQVRNKLGLPEDGDINEVTDMI